jgi:hypothetical protein
MGLTLLIAVVLSLVAVAIAPVLAYHVASRLDASVRLRRIIAAAVFMAIYGPVFGDWLPTVWLHSHYCSEYSALTIYKTPEEWRRQNTRLAEDLQPPSRLRQEGRWPNFAVQVNQRLWHEVESTEMRLGIIEHEDRLVDRQAGETLVRRIDFSTGQSGLKSVRDLKVWMHRNSCDPAYEGSTSEKFMATSQAFTAPPQ